MSELKPMNYKENYEDLIPKGSFRISPSMIHKFTSKKYEWFNSQILGNEQFEDCTATVLGSLVHRIAEGFIKNRAVDRQELIDYAESFRSNDKVDVDYILSQWKPMGQALIDYLEAYGIPDRSEEAIAAEVLDEVYAGGTADAVLGDILIDFKTTSSLTTKDYIPLDYKQQLLTYAWIYRQKGIDINYIRIVWITNHTVGRVSEKTGKPMKDYPAKVEVVTEMITDDDMKFIEDYLKLIGETYWFYKTNPYLAYIIFGDYRLK